LILDPAQKRSTFRGQYDAANSAVFFVLLALSQSLAFQSTNDSLHPALGNRSALGKILQRTKIIATQRIHCAYSP
jgi:hypothetical protein